MSSTPTSTCVRRPEGLRAFGKGDAVTDELSLLVTMQRLHHLFWRLVGDLAKAPERRPSLVHPTKMGLPYPSDNHHVGDGRAARAGRLGRRL